MTLLAKVWVSPRSALVAGLRWLPGCAGCRAALVAGLKTDHLRNSCYEAKRASKLVTLATGLSVIAHPLLFTVGVASIMIKQRLDDVTVLTSLCG